MSNSVYQTDVAGYEIRDADGEAIKTFMEVQDASAAGAYVVNAGAESLEISQATQVTATIADAANHAGLFIVKQTSSGTAGHTLTLTAGTFDGTNNIATLNAQGEALIVYFDSAGDGVIVENIGAVALS